MVFRKYRSPLLIFIAGTISFTGTLTAQVKKPQQDSADQKELYNYALTMDKIQKLGNAIRGLNDLSKQHPELNSDSSSDKTIDQVVQKIQKYPEAIVVLSKSSLTPREFAVGSMTLIQAALAVGFKKAGTYKEYPPEMLKLVSPANLAFVEQHYDDIGKVIPELSGSGHETEDEK